MAARTRAAPIRGALVAVLVATVALWAWSTTRTPSYRAMASVVVPELTPSLRPVTFPDLAGEAPVVGRSAEAAARRGADPREERVSIHLPRDRPRTVVIAADGPSGGTAQRLADTVAEGVAEGYSRWAAEVLQAERDALSTRADEVGGGAGEARTALEGEIATVVGAAARLASSPPAVEGARIPADARRPLGVGASVAGLGVAALLGSGVGIMVDRRSRRIRTLADLPMVATVVPLAAVPASADRRSGTAAIRAVARALRTAGDLGDADAPRVVMVTALADERACELVAAGLAHTLRRAGGTITLVEMVPGGGVDPEPDALGLRDVVAGHVELGDVVVRGPAGIWLLPAGTPDVPLLGHERRLAAVVSAAERTSTTVVVAGPSPTSPEWPVAASLGDHTILVLASGEARRSTVLDLAEAGLGPGPTSVVIVDPPARDDVAI